MYTVEQLSQAVIEQTKEIAALKESTKSAHKRIDDNEEIISGIHKIATNVAEIATEIKLLTARFDKSIEHMEQGLKTQGERISKVEHNLHQVERNEKAIIKHAEKLELIEKAPGEKWNKLTWLIIAGAATAIVAFLMGKLL